MSQSSDVRDYLNQRFDLDPDGEFYYSGDYWYCREPEERYETSGVRAVRDMDIGLKPTTYFLQLLGPHIGKNRVEISREDLEVLTDGGMIQYQGLEKGYVALFFEGRCIGCGFYMDELISSRIPEGRANELVNSLI